MASAAALSQRDSDTTEELHILNAGERAWRLLTGCRSHNWSFPQSSKDMRASYRAFAPYDSHQQCPKCGAQRLFNSKTMEGGPLFTKEIKQRG